MRALEHLQGGREGVVYLHPCKLHATSSSEELSTMISKQILLVQNLKRKCEMIDVVTHDRIYR